MALHNKPDEHIFASEAKQGEVDNFPDLLRGWGISFEQTGGIPPMEWFNWLFKRADEKHGYLMQRGLPEWSETQDYPAGAFVQYNNLSYKSLIANKNKRPDEVNSTDWQRWGFTLTEIAKASLTQQGIVQLTNTLNSDAENLALTAKAGKVLAQQIVQAKQEIERDYIPNSKKSSAVNSNSADTVATSEAVKTAYDKAVDARNTADRAQTSANDGISRANNAQVAANNAKTAADGAQRTANDGVSKATTAQNTANSAVTKADNAQRAADNANNNANGRVLKSGDTMIGMLKITSSNITYRVNGYGWPKKIELSGDSVIGNEACVIGFNNNGTLHLGGKPNSSEFNASINETGLWVKGDVVTKSGASLNNAFMKTDRKSVV